MALNRDKFGLSEDLIQKVKQVIAASEEEVETIDEGRPSQKHPLEGHEYHKKSDSELEYIAKDALKAAEAMKGHNTDAENKYRDQASNSATVRHFRKTSGMPTWYKKKYGHIKKSDMSEDEQIDEEIKPYVSSYVSPFFKGMRKAAILNREWQVLDHKGEVKFSSTNHATARSHLKNNYEKYRDPEYTKYTKEEVEAVDEKASDREVKMATGIPHDKRYVGGNMTGAITAIERIRKNLSKHPRVAASLKAANEEINLDKDLAYPSDGGVEIVESHRSAESHELVLYADNTERLYNTSHVPVAKNLEKRFKKGTYDHEKAKKLWKYHADRSADSYAKEYGSPGQKGHHIFSVKDRHDAASYFADRHHDEMKASNFHEETKVYIEVQANESAALDTLMQEDKPTRLKYLEALRDRMREQLRLAAAAKSKRAPTSPNLAQTMNSVNKLTMSKEEQDFISALNSANLEEGRGRPPKEGSAAYIRQQKGKQDAEPDQHIVNQMKKAADSTETPYSITYKDGSKHPLHHTDAKKALDRYMAEKPSGKRKIQQQLAKSHANMRAFVDKG